MKQIINKLLETIGILLPFLKKKDVKEIREFSTLITGQYEFLVEQLEKVLKDYFELSDKVTEMHNEIFNLRAELHKSVSQRCEITDCDRRIIKQ